jgi:hypothetical protein
LAAKPKDFSADMKILFNYFESIAIGVSREQYDKNIVHDQLKPIIVEHVNDLLVSGLSAWDKPAEYFDHTMKLYDEWKTS